MQVPQLKINEALKKLVLHHDASQLQIMILYDTLTAGPSMFEEFGLNEEVCKVFTQTVLKKMKESSVNLLGVGDESHSEPRDGNFPLTSYLFLIFLLTYD